MRVFLFCYGIWRGGFAAEDIMADSSSGASPKLPANLELQRTRVVCAVDAPSYVRHFFIAIVFSSCFDCSCIAFSGEFICAS